MPKTNWESPSWSSHLDTVMSVKAPSRWLAVALAGGSLIVLSGCSVDGMLWGPEGAQVTYLTEQLIDEAASGEQSALACQDFAADFGEAGMWEGLSAGEPEQFEAGTSVDRPTSDATWRINLEGADAGASSGEEVPTDVFYRETDAGLCVADIIWQPITLG